MRCRSKNCDYEIIKVGSLSESICDGGPKAFFPWLVPYIDDDWQYIYGY